MEIKDKGEGAMCGICGFPRDTVERKQMPGRMMRAVWYRGPDRSAAGFESAGQKNCFIDTLLRRKGHYEKKIYKESEEKWDFHIDMCSCFYDQYWNDDRLFDDKRKCRGCI